MATCDRSSYTIFLGIYKVYRQTAVQNVLHANQQPAQLPIYIL